MFATALETLTAACRDQLVGRGRTGTMSLCAMSACSKRGIGISDGVGPHEDPCVRGDDTYPDRWTKRAGRVPGVGCRHLTTVDTWATRARRQDALRAGFAGVSGLRVGLVWAKLSIGEL